ncbi:50S ribosomal protein L31 [Candidatus Uhrbacteria bacterium]|nr:MAG: 50S ribosomal protein L31 [Candidatus Uhrbacteria bacterium]
MKAEIHPEYHSDAKISCLSCGYEVTTGSTQPEIKVELCFKCHPFYTGKQQLVDTAGRVDRFKSIQTKASKKAETATSKKEKAAKRAAKKEEKEKKASKKLQVEA